MEPLRVLSVEDDDFDAHRLAKTLGRAWSHGVEVERATDGASALAALFDDGYRGPVILLTGVGSERVAAEASRAGSDDYMRKEDPDEDTLRECLTRVLTAHKAEESQRRFEGSLYEMATCDPVTGLFNRRYFTTRLSEETLRTARYGNPLCPMAIDIVGLPLIQEHLGPQRCDTVLGNVAVTLRGLLRVTDIFCRYADGRFVIALIETPPDIALEAGHRIVQVLEDAPVFAPGGDALPLDCAVAIRPVLEPDPDPDSLLIDVFSLLAAAGTGGRDRVALAPMADV